MPPIKTEGNGAISSRGMQASTSCGSTRYIPSHARLTQMLAAIGETLEKEGDEEVMGVVVNARKGFYRIGLWTKTCSNTEVLRAIGYETYFALSSNSRKRFKEVLKLPESEKVEFNAHADSERAGGSSRAKTKMAV